MHFYQKTLRVLAGFLKSTSGVTAIEYAVIAVGLAAILGVVFNPNGGAFYDAMMQARDSMVAIFNS